MHVIWEGSIMSIYRGTIITTQATLNELHETCSIKILEQLNHDEWEIEVDEPGMITMDHYWGDAIWSLDTQPDRDGA